MWTILLILPLGGEGTWAVRTGSSIVMETPAFCWLMDLRVKVSPNVTKESTRTAFSHSTAGSLPATLHQAANHSSIQMCQMSMTWQGARAESHCGDSGIVRFKPSSQQCPGRQTQKTSEIQGRRHQMLKWVQTWASENSDSRTSPTFLYFMLHRWGQGDLY